MSADLRDAAGVLDLDGKIAVVTGAASGIGLALSRRLAYEGARVVMADVQADRLAAATADLRAQHLEVEDLMLDAADAAAVDKLAERAFALGPVGVVCLNAGVPGPVGEHTWEISIAEWESVIRVNMWGPIVGAHAFVPRLLGQGTVAHVMFTISQGGLFTNPMSAPYFTSKHAIYALARILYEQLLQSPVRISAVCPGAVQTPLLESLRRGIREADARGTLRATGGRIDPNRPTLAPSQVAKAVADAIGSERFHVIMNPEYRKFYEGHVEGVLREWPDAPAGQPSVRPVVERFVAAFESAAIDDIRSCFRADASKGDAEARGLGGATLGEVPSILRTTRFACVVKGRPDGSVAVEWSARHRVGGDSVADGVDVFAGDASSIWSVQADGRLA